MNEEIKWIDLRRNIRGPKMEWLELQLRLREIPYIRGIAGLHGEIVRVPEEFLVEGQKVLMGEVGEFYLPLDKIVWDDLPNDHPIFLNEDIRPPVPKEIIESTGFVHFEDVQVSDIVVRMYDVDSTNVSALGFVAKNFVICRYKGGDTFYRYSPMQLKSMENLLQEIENKVRKVPGASVGKLFNALCKFPADDGLKQCDKFEDGRWWVVPPKAKRKKGQALPLSELTWSGITQDELDKARETSAAPIETDAVFTGQHTEDFMARIPEEVKTALEGPLPDRITKMVDDDIARRETEAVPINTKTAVDFYAERQIPSFADAPNPVPQPAKIELLEDEKDEVQHNPVDVMQEPTDEWTIPE